MDASRLILVLTLYAVVTGFAFASADDRTTTRPSTSNTKREDAVKAVFAAWSEELMRPGKQPPPDAEYQFIRHDTGNSPVDIIRVTYQSDGDKVTLSQTLCLFCVKVEDMKDLHRDGDIPLDDVRWIAARYLRSADDLAIEWIDKKTPPHEGRAKENQPRMAAPLRTLHFVLRPSAILFFGLKAQDSPSALRLGWGASMNRFWFTEPDRASVADNDEERALQVLLR